MRIVKTEKELKDAVIAAKREAKSSFDDDRVFLEKYIEHLRVYKKIKLEVFPTCSVLFGKHDDVMEALSLSIKWSVENKNKVVFISKFLPNYEAI